MSQLALANRCCMPCGSEQCAQRCSSSSSAADPPAAPGRTHGCGDGSRPGRTGRPSDRAACRSRLPSTRALRCGPRPSLDLLMSTQRTIIKRWPFHVGDRHAVKITIYGWSTSGAPPQPDEPCGRWLPVLEQAHAGTCGQCGRPPPLATPRYVDHDAKCVSAGQVRCRCAVERAPSTVRPPNSAREGRT
jgi:hypothetical protein